MAEAYTGHHDWKDYRAEFTLTPLTGEHHMVNVRVQGAIRSYAAGLLPNGKAAILKNDNGYQILEQTDFAWETGKEYVIALTVKENLIKMEINGNHILKAADEERPYLQGSIGGSMQNGSHDKYRRIRVMPIPDC